MPITDLTGYTWVGNNSLLGFGDISTYNLSFTSNNVSFSTFNFKVYSSRPVVFCLSYDSTNAFIANEETGWTNSAYKTIQITGGQDATNSTLIAWLQNNGTLTAPSPTPTGINKTKLGTKSIVKKTIGTKEVIKEVVNGVVVYEKSSTPSGYSGNITASSYAFTGSGQTFIKFGSAPSSNSDYDSFVYVSGTLTGTTTYTDQTKAYIWSDGYSGGVRINGTVTNCNSTTYSNAVEITLTSNYDIELLYKYSGGGGGAQ